MGTNAKEPEAKRPQAGAKPRQGRWNPDPSVVEQQKAQALKTKEQKGFLEGRLAGALAIVRNSSNVLTAVP